MEGAIKTWFPDHYEAYTKCIATLVEKYPNLRKPSASSIFPAMTLNLGPQSWCWPHRDQFNLAFGICLDWVLGKFNHRVGGHLILHEAKVILELSPGRVVLFPSACITHENLPIGEGESRYAVTGYIAGGFWRWIAQGFVTRETWKKFKPDEVAEHDSKAGERWEKGFNMFKTKDQLIAAAKARVSHGLTLHPSPLPTSAP